MESIKKIDENSISRLNDSALLALILSSEAPRYISLEKAMTILNNCNDSISQLANLSISDLALLPGLKNLEAIKIKAIFELSSRKNTHEILEKPKIKCSREVFELFEYLSEKQYEEFWILILNKANKIIDRVRISEGGVSGTTVDAKRIFKSVIDVLGSAVVLIHNHPSGNTKPFDQDIHLTKKIVEAGKIARYFCSGSFNHRPGTVLQFC